MSGRQNVESLGRKLCAGRQMDPPFIEIKTGPCQFGRMDGRHRLIAACRAGIKRAPLDVLFRKDKDSPYETRPEGEAKRLFARCLR